MPTPEDSAKQDDLARFKNEVAQGLKKLASVQVITVVTSSQAVDPEKPPSGPYLLTVIDLLGGDIRFEVSDTLLEEKYAPIPITK